MIIFTIPYDIVVIVIGIFCCATILEIIFVIVLFCDGFVVIVYVFDVGFGVVCCGLGFGCGVIGCGILGFVVVVYGIVILGFGLCGCICLITI